MYIIFPDTFFSFCVLSQDVETYCLSLDQKVKEVYFTNKWYVYYDNMGEERVSLCSSSDNIH